MSTSYVGYSIYPQVTIMASLSLDPSDKNEEKSKNNDDIDGEFSQLYIDIKIIGKKGIIMIFCKIGGIEAPFKHMCLLNNMKISSVNQLQSIDWLDEERIQFISMTSIEIHLCDKEFSLEKR